MTTENHIQQLPQTHTNTENHIQQLPQTHTNTEDHIQQLPQTHMAPQDYMRLALQLARKGEGRTSPNPMVGCVVVKDGKVISTGYHEFYGGFHAERNALLRCPADPAGADIYVNLEPCCHHGKTPPCTDIIIEKKIRRVYVGCLDSNPKVAGKGIQILRSHGISVETGILEEECRTLNEVFFHFMEHRMPFLAMKYAMTLDGKIASETGDSKWVTGEESRAYVQRLRNRYRGIMAGIGTVLADDPLLSCRMEGGRNPVRIICDSRLRIPLDSKIVKTAPYQETILAYHRQEALDWRRQNNPTASPDGSPTDTALASESQCSTEEASLASFHAVQKALAAQGITLLEIPLQRQGDSAQLDLRFLLQALAERHIDSILLEGGGILNASALTSHLVQRVYAFIAPKLIAGSAAKSPIEGAGIPKMSDALKLGQIETSVFGKDFCISGRLCDN